MSVGWIGLFGSPGTHTWLESHLPPLSDTLIAYLLWEEFFFVAFRVAAWVTMIALIPPAAVAIRRRVLLLRLREGRADGPHDTADNVRDVMRDMTFDRLPWLR